MPQLDSPITIKTPEEIKIMHEGGQILAMVKRETKKMIKPGVNAQEVEALATKLIEAAGAEPSFKKVPGYNWSTCINVNEGVVHGIPHKHVVFKQGDVVSVDVGVYLKGFHTDSAFSMIIEPTDAKTKDFLKAGRLALQKAINEARLGNRIYDISIAIESTLKRYKLRPVEKLVGHGVGRQLHEDPQIPGFVYESRKESQEIIEGMTLAIEVMYTPGKGTLRLAPDAWTILTRDGKIAALFEETVAVTGNGPFILTG